MRVWVLDRRIFQAIMMKTGLQRQEENINFLKRYKVFTVTFVLTPRLTLFRRVDKMHCHPQEVIHVYPYCLEVATRQHLIYYQTACREFDTAVTFLGVCPFTLVFVHEFDIIFFIKKAYHKITIMVIYKKVHYI